MNKNDPRDWRHQERGVEMARRRFVGPNAVKSLVAVMATGGGKSRWAGMIIESHIKKAAEFGRRAQALFIVNRRNLVLQMASSLADNFGIKSGIIMDGYQYTPGLPCYCASIDTLWPRLRDGALDGASMFPEPLDPTLIVVDEAHHAVTKQYRKVFDTFPNAYMILQTATPERQDGRGLGDVAQAIIDIADYKYLQEKGILAKVRYFVAPPDGLAELENKKRGREVSEAHQADLYCRPKIVGDVVQSWLRHAEGRKTIVFCVNVAHAVAEAAEFERSGVRAAILHARSKDDERAEVFRKMENNEITIVCNVGLYVEGMDAPDVWCVQVARRVGGLGTWRQMVGRGARIPFPSEHNDLIVIDHGGNLDRHGPVDEEMVWSLEPDKPAAQRKKLEPKEKKLCKCKFCGCEFNSKKCPDCGTELKKIGKRVESVSMELIESSGIASPKKSDWIEKRMVLGALRWHAVSKGWREGWAAHAYRNIFGVWPRGSKINSVPPVYPEPGSSAERYVKLALTIQKRQRRAGHVGK